MTFSFDEALGDDVSIVRMLINDVVDSGHKVEDETIQFFIDEEQNNYEAGASVAEQLSAKYAATGTSRSIGELSIGGLSLTDQYANLAFRLRNHRRRNGVPIGFGWNKTEKAIQELDTNREPIISKKGGMDYPGTSEEI